jgi:hypothetical protein
MLVMLQKMERHPLDIVTHFCVGKHFLHITKEGEDPPYAGISGWRQ